MAVIANTSINLKTIKAMQSELLEQGKIVNGDKGSYLKLEVVVNDELDDYENQVSVRIAQTKEERENKADKTYLGNGRVVWTNNKAIPNTYDLLDNKDGGGAQGGPPQVSAKDMNDDELPF